MCFTAPQNKNVSGWDVAPDHTVELTTLPDPLVGWGVSCPSLNPILSTPIGYGAWIIASSALTHRGRAAQYFFASPGLWYSMVLDEVCRYDEQLTLRCIYYFMIGWFR